MKMLVTGGAGFIGSNYIKYTLDKYKQIEIICLDLLTYAGNIDNIHDFLCDPRFHFVQGDICDEKLLNELYEKYKFDTIINFAAETHVDNSIKDSKAFIKSNVDGVRSLLDLTRKHNLYFHQISTDEVYGPRSIDDNHKFITTSRLNPTNPYSASKAAADLLVLSYINTYNINATISRSSNNYGKNQHPEKFIPHSIKLINEGKPIEIYGQGREKRDYIPVEFNVHCIDKIIHSHHKTIYNICSEIEYSSIEIAYMILEHLGKSKSQVCFVKNRPGHDAHYPMKSSFSYKKYLSLKSKSNR